MEGLPERRAVLLGEGPAPEEFRLDGLRFTLVADRAQAKTYVRANALLDSVNSSMFFGDPFTLVIRDAVSPEEEKALLSSPGVLYVREELPVPAPLPGRPA